MDGLRRSGADDCILCVCDNSPLTSDGKIEEFRMWIIMHWVFCKQGIRIAIDTIISAQGEHDIEKET